MRSYDTWQLVTYVLCVCLSEGSILIFRVFFMLYYPQVCAGKGYVCEICHKWPPIYPFQFEHTVRCPKCEAMYHKVCSVL